MKNYTFKVEGGLQFPLNMLRYDACWPFDSDSVSEIHATMDVETRLKRRRDKGSFIVTLCTNQPGVTKERWSSFGWRVVR